MKPAKGKILIIRGGAIGDFILTLPAIAAMRRQFPSAHLEILGYPHIAQLAGDSALVDALKPIEARALAGFFAAGGDLDAGWCDYFSEFDLILSYLYDPDGIFQGNVARCSPARFLSGPHRPDDNGPDHATRALLKPLEQLAIFDACTVPRIVIESTDPQPACLALHPGSGSEKKNWPEQNWAELIRRLIETTAHPLLIVGGEAEGERLDRLTRALPAGRVMIARSLPLRELAARLQSCVAFVGHDSGITHLAAALEVPTVVLWGPTVRRVWQPLGPRVFILESRSGLQDLQTGVVLNTVHRAVSPI